MNGLQYLLDANIISEMVRSPKSRVYRRVREVGHATVCTSIIVACELRFGIAKSASRRLEDNLSAIIDSLPVLPFDRDADIHYGRIRAALVAAGRPIGANDLFIAAHAMSLGLTLVTHNTREFARVDGLIVEDWLA